MLVWFVLVVASVVESELLYEESSKTVTAKACECGPHSLSCTFVGKEWNIKICTCEDGYAQAPNGTCIKPCGCQNGGWCHQNLCTCNDGRAYGPHCELVYGCEDPVKGAFRCGDPLEVACSRFGCSCLNDSLTYFSRERVCRECNCGPRGECSLNKGKKECKCDKNYAMAEKGAYLEGECRPCNCGSNSNGCKFNITGKFCNCKTGFAQRAGICKECACGEHATCSFEGYRKTCTCDKGYVLQDGTCVECDCGPHCSCYYDENHQKISTCNPDAIRFGEECVECNCGLDGTCTLNEEGKKKCKCDQGFAEREGLCIDCQCYYDDKPVGCSFTNKTQNCFCPPGYTAMDFFCLEETSIGKYF